MPCGIGGILRFDGQPVRRDRLQAMRLHLAPRGPDGQGIDIQGACGLVHTRLSVVDLMGGDQPMHVGQSESAGPLTLIFNGEIYNHRQLRRQLEKLGHRFASSHCDTEVLLHGYREWGTELPKHLHGMFAFAVWDGADQSLFLARDRAGKKPLYLFRDQRQLAFGSLIGTVLAGLDTRPPIDHHALGHYLTFGYTGLQTLLHGVWELEAGHWILVERAGRFSMKRYWQPPPLSRSSTRLGAVEAARELLDEAVARRMEADVPLGCFLSGGVDSSMIAALAQRHLPKGQRLKTFSVSMTDQRYDEAPWAQRVASHIGAEHHQLTAEMDIQADLRRLVATVGEPFADSSILPTYWLSRATREHVVVALSGDGGDELFGGYDRYRAMRMIQRHRWWLRHLPMPGVGQAEQKSLLTRIGRLVEAARPADQARQYLRMIRLFSPTQLGELGFREVATIDQPPGWEQEIDPAEASRRWDLFDYLPFDLLRKVDRASMAVALEVRCPMLDTQVCDFAFHLPLRVLAPWGQPKRLLKQAAADLLPPEVLARPKMGFAVPIGLWFRTTHRSMLREHLLEGRLVELGCRRERLERMIGEHETARADHTHRLFALLSLSMWLDWCQDPQPA